MKLGILTAPFPETPLTDVAEWASSAGFETLEIACWPKSTGPTRRYAGTSHIDVAGAIGVQGQGDRRALAAKGCRSRRWAIIRIRCIRIQQHRQPSSIT